MSERRLSNFAKIDGRRFAIDPNGYAYDGIPIRSVGSQVMVCLCRSHESSKMVLEALENQADREEEIQLRL